MKSKIKYKYWVNNVKLWKSPNNNGKYEPLLFKFKCQKCGLDFETTNDDLDEKSALCDKCWKQLVDYTHDYSKTAEDRANYHLTYLTKK